MAISLITSISAVGDPSTVTTGSVDTTGANLLVVALACSAAGSPTISDSKGNTWTALTLSALTVKSQIYYTLNPTVGSGHTFTSSGSFVYASIAAAAFSGVKTSSAFDQENGATASASTIATGSVTPTENNELLIAALGFNGSGTPTSIDTSFTQIESQNFGSGNNYGVSLAYRVLATAGATNPTWTRTNSNANAARIATFKEEPATSNTNFFIFM